LLQKYENAAAGAPTIVRQGEESADFWRLLNSGVSLIGKPPAAASAAVAMASQVWHICGGASYDFHQQHLRLNTSIHGSMQASTNYLVHQTNQIRYTIKCQSL
jgi:hypothetical protein